MEKYFSQVFIYPNIFPSNRIFFQYFKDYKRKNQKKEIRINLRKNRKVKFDLERRRRKDENSLHCPVSHSLFFISSFFCPREAWISVNRTRFEQWTDSMQGNQFWGGWMAICFSAAAIRIMATIRGDCLSGDIRQTTCTEPKQIFTTLLFNIL